MGVDSKHRNVGSRLLGAGEDAGGAVTRAVDFERSADLGDRVAAAGEKRPVQVESAVGEATVAVPVKRFSWPDMALTLPL